MITFLAWLAHFLVFELYKKINYWSKDCLMTTEWKNREADTLKRYFIYFKKMPSKLFLPHRAEKLSRGQISHISSNYFLSLKSDESILLNFASLKFDFLIYPFLCWQFILLIRYHHWAYCLYWVIYIKKNTGNIFLLFYNE